MNDLNQHFTDADFEDEEVDENQFDAELGRRERREGRMVDEYLDEEAL